MFFSIGVLTVVTSDATILPAVFDFPPLLQWQSLPYTWGGGLVNAAAGIACAAKVPTTGAD